MTTKLAIIGTAGRKLDQGMLTSEHYPRMIHAVYRLIDHLKIDTGSLHLVSGGAAWSDHVAVSLVLEGLVPAERLSLYLPAKLEYYGFEGGEDFDQRTADTANYYHKLFSQKIGRDSIAELHSVRKQGATLEPIAGGFFSRNSLVAQNVGTDGHLLAFTFGSQTTDQESWTIRSFGGTVKAKDAGLKDGGTADTFNKCKANKHHALLGVFRDDQISI